MSSSLEEISRLALALPERSRAQLAERLLASLGEGTTASHEAAWLALAKQRNAELEAGTASTRTLGEIMASAREALAKAPGH